MSITKTKTKGKSKKITTNTKVKNVQKMLFQKDMVENATIFRREMLEQMLNPGKDINYECGYPDTIGIEDYKKMYDREGLGARVVSLFPEECWGVPPVVKEKEEGDETTFDKEWKALEKKLNINQYLKRIDILSGIGEFGILLLGINDGKEFSEPVEGINEFTGEKEGKKEHELLYLRPFDQSVVKIATTETDKKSPRFGFPKTYTIEFQTTEASTQTITSSTLTVHWTRVIHIADNRDTSEILGRPRQKQVWNRLLDVRKVLSGSAEMFWKGAYPGYAFEVNPEQTDATIDAAALKAEMADYASGLQRYFATTGVTVKSLDVQVADPKGHLDVQITYIALTIGVPTRVFMGTEEAKLASGQDMKIWNTRVMNRQSNYVSPMIIREFIDRLLAFGILPEAAEYFIIWQDLNTPSDTERMEVAVKMTEAMAKYVAADVQAIMGPKEYFMIVLGMSDKEAKEIEKGAIGFQDDSIDENELDEE